MNVLAERISGRDSVSGNIVKVGILGVEESGDDGELLNLQLTIDSGHSVFVLSSRKALGAMLRRKDRTATFVGEFMDDARKNLCCEEMYFWDTFREA